MFKKNIAKMTSHKGDSPPLPSPPLPSPPLPSPPLPSLHLVTERIHSPFQPKQSPSLTSCRPTLSIVGPRFSNILGGMLMARISVHVIVFVCILCPKTQALL